MFTQLQKWVSGSPDGGQREPEKKLRQSVSRHLMFGMVLVMLLMFGVGGWTTVAEITSAVIAPGTVVVDSNIKKVQHSTGGTVGELHVRDGDKVEARDVLVRLDDTVTRANLAVISKELDALFARKARLEAEHNDTAVMQVPPELAGRLAEAEVAHMVEREQRLFEMRGAARDGQKAQLTERTVQIEQEIEGNLAQERANTKELALVRQELEGARVLWEKKLIPIGRYTELERTVPRLEGVRGQLMAAVARARGQISEIQLQIIQIDRDLGTEVGQELRQAESRISELVEHRIAAEDQLRKVDIRAPQSGIVHQLAVHAVGEVIAPDGAPIMLIVPDAEELMVEARVRPQDIDQIDIGDAATIRLSAFNQRTTPEVFGTVNRISADTSDDPRTGEAYYTIRLAVSDPELARLGELRLMPGMPIEAFVQTGSRTVLSHLIKPIGDHVARAFREE